jgi:hypothetical protein
MKTHFSEKKFRGRFFVGILQVFFFPGKTGNAGESHGNGSGV